MSKIKINGISIETDTSGRWVDIKEVEKIINTLTSQSQKPKKVRLSPIEEITPSSAKRKISDKKIKQMVASMTKAHKRNKK